MNLRHSLSLTVSNAGLILKVLIYTTVLLLVGFALFSAITEPIIEAVDSGTWKIRGEAPLEEVAQTLGITLPCGDFDTFNGLVFGALSVIPQDGSTVEVETAGLIIRVTEIRNHQVKSALVCLEEPQNKKPL